VLADAYVRRPGEIEPQVGRPLPSRRPL